MGTRRSQEDKDEIERLALELASARNCRSAWQDLANTLRGELNEAKAEIKLLKESSSLEICSTESDDHYHDLRAELADAKAEIERLNLEISRIKSPNCTMVDNDSLAKLARAADTLARIHATRLKDTP